MKYLCVIVCLIFPFLGFGQTEKEIKSMLTDYRHFHNELDSITQKIILENAWNTVYSCNKKLFWCKPKKNNSYSILKFEGEKFFLISFDENKNSPKTIYGNYIIDGRFLMKYFIKSNINHPENTHYEIINLINNEYLVVELWHYKERKNGNTFKSFHRRLLYQIQLTP
jgi:hypothetical protein